MSAKNRTFSEAEIDELVEAQADDAAAWSKSTHVHRKANTASVALRSELATRASFIARLHGEARLEDWLARVIEERVALEEAMYAELKRDLTKNDA